MGCFVAELMAPSLQFNHELGGFSALDTVQIAMRRSNSPLFLRPAQGLLQDGLGLDSAALRSSLEKDEAFCFLAYVFLSQLYSLISTVRQYREDLDGWDALWMQCALEGALPLAIGWLLDFVPKMFQVSKPSPSRPVLIKLHETGPLVSIGLLAM